MTTDITTDLRLLQAKISKDLLKKVTNLSIDRSEPRQDTVEFLLRIGLRNLKSD